VSGAFERRARATNMSNTTTTYLGIEHNLARYQKATAAEPSVKTATAYYTANIGKVTSAKALVSNYRLLSYALRAYGLGDQINNRALITKVLDGGVSNPRALANTLPNPAWKAFATAFNFSATAAAAPNSAESVTTTTHDYVEQQLESDQGQTDPGVQLALYFARVAPSVSDTFGILGNRNMLEVVQTIFGLASTTSASQIDAEEAAVRKLVPKADLQDPTKLEKLVERFTARYDAKYGPASQTGGSLTVTSGNETSADSVASTILASLISSNAASLARLSPNTSISTALLASWALSR
jgi:hypothetical protein